MKWHYQFFAGMILFSLFLWTCGEPFDDDNPFAREVFAEEWSARDFTGFTSSNEVPAPQGETSVTVTVRPNIPLRKIPRTLLGFNLSNDAGNNPVQVDSVMTHYQNLAPRVLRFPGGLQGDLYFWNATDSATFPDFLDSNLIINCFEEALSPVHNQVSGHIPLLDFYSLVQQNGNQAIMQVNYSLSNYADAVSPGQRLGLAADYAADWVHEVNNVSALGIKFWEIGNASWSMDAPTRKLPDGSCMEITAAEYAQDFIAFADSMNQADPRIYVGAVARDDGWTESCLAVDGFAERADFLAIQHVFNSSGAAVNINAILDEADEIEILTNAYHTAILGSGYSVQDFSLAMTSYHFNNPGNGISGSHAGVLFYAKALAELIENNWDMATMFAMSDGKDMSQDLGLLAHDLANATEGRPAPAYFAFYYLSRLFGDTFISSSSNITGIRSYASSWSSGELVVILINESIRSEIVSIELEDASPGSSYYWFEILSEDGDPFSRRVLINGEGAEIGQEQGGPADYSQIAPYTLSTTDGIRVASQPYSLNLILIEREL